jgi:hypothetical protein
MGRIRRIFLFIIVDVDIAGGGGPDTGVTFVKNVNEKKQIAISRFWLLEVILIIHVIMPEVSLVYPKSKNQLPVFPHQKKEFCSAKRIIP